MTREERNAWQREYRLLVGNIGTFRYEKTKKGFLMRTYRNMKSRVEGVQKLKSHLYTGKDLLDKNVFYDWALNNYDFNSLFKTWEVSDYIRTLTPSIDRIRTDKGYVIENMQWITHSENSRKGVISRWQNT